MYSGIISIDANRIRFAVRDWKAMLALKILSARIREILAGTVRDPQKVLSYKQQQWVGIWQQIFSQAGKRMPIISRDRREASSSSRTSRAALAQG